MSKDDQESYTPGDPEWNKELINEIRKKARKSKPITEEDRIEQIQDCLDEGAHVDAIDNDSEDDNRALHIAVEKGYKEVAKFLVEKGARTDITNKNGHTALTLAKALGEEDILSTLTELVGDQNNASTAAVQLAPSIAIASSFDQGASTSRDGAFSPSYNTPAALLGQRSKRTIAESGYAENSKRRRLETPSADQQPEARVIVPSAESQDSYADYYSQSEEEDDDEINRQESPIFGGENEYAASGLKQTLHGNIYQLKLLMLFVKRGLRKGYAFRLATEMDAAEKFDDVVFQYAKMVNGTRVKVCRYLQAKHRQDESKKISPFELLNETDGDFSLKKYFDSYRKIMKHPELSKNQFESCILCSNIGFELSDKKNEQMKFRVKRDGDRDLRPEDLDVLEFGLNKVEGYDALLDVENSLKPSTRYKLVINNRHKLHHILRSSADAYVLARTLAEHVFYKKEINLSVRIYKQCHIALATYVLDVPKKGFSANFVNNDGNLSAEVKNFRKIFRAEFLRLMKLPDVDSNEFSMWAKIREEKLKLSSTFGAKFEPKVNTALTNLSEFSKAFVKLMQSSSTDNLVEIDREIYKQTAPNGSDEKVIGVNIDKLAGDVLIVEDNEIKFSSKFLDDNMHGRLSVGMKAFKGELKKLLNGNWKDIKEYRFKVKNSPRHWDLLFASSNLPNDDIKSDDIRDFFDKLIFAVSQPNEVELGKIMQNEIGEYKSLNVLSEDLVSNSFQIKMLDWFKEKGKESGKEGVFFTSEDGQAFFESMEMKVNNLICSGLSSSYPEELKEYGIEFDDENQEVKNFLTNENKRILNLISTGETLPTAIRLHKTIQKQEKYMKDHSLIFVHLRSLRSVKTKELVIGSFRSQDMYDLLVIDCGSPRDVDLERLRKLYVQVYKLMQNRNYSAKKFIFITQEIKNSSGIITNLFPDCEETTDEVRFNSLGQTSREKLLEKRVIYFHGVKRTGISFRELLGNLADFADVIDPCTLVKLVCGDRITLGDSLNTLGEVEDFYVDRYFNQQVFLREKILKSQLESDVFAVSGIEKSELEDLVTDPEEIHSFSEIDQKIPLSYKFITLSSDRDIARSQFRTVCKNYSNDTYNVHWLERKWNNLIWKKSQGNISNLVAYRDSGESFGVNVEKIAAKCFEEDQLQVDDDERRRVVIISDIAGMGKSTVFTHLANKIMEGDSGSWVIRIDLSEFTGVLDQEKKEREQTGYRFRGSVHDRAVEFFVEKLSKLKTDSEKRIFKAMIQNYDRVALLFDGFDEIHPEYREIVIDVLQAFKNSIGVKKLFVSTRPHTSEALEKKLEVFSYAMEQFSVDDQTSFLIMFWKKRLNLEEAEERIVRRLKTYAEAVILKLAGSIDDRAKKFTGIPLQTRMIAEIFERNREREQADFETCQEFLGSENDEPRLPENMNIINLYDRFVNLKFNIYVEAKMKMVRQNLGVEEVVEHYRQKFNKTHEVLALHTLFKTEGLKTLVPDFNITKGIKKRHMSEKNNKGEEPIGFIIRSIDGEPQFIHRSYAEYFAANFFIEKLLMPDVPRVTNDPEVIKLIVELLLEPDYNVVRAFLNGLLLKNYSYPLEEQYDDNPFADGSLKSALAETQDMSWGNILHITIVERNNGILKYVLNQYSELDETWNQLITATCEDAMSNPETPLSLAIKQGYYDALKILLEHDRTCVNNLDHRYGTLMHYAASEGNLERLQWLVQNGADLHTIDVHKKTPLHYAAFNGNLGIVQFLVQKGANVHAIDSGNQTPLHIAAIANNLAVVQWLVQNGADLHAIDNKNQTPLHNATIRNNLVMVQWLVQQGAKLHAIDNYKRTPLHLAAGGKYSDDLVQWLVQEGADIHATDIYNQTALHAAVLINNLATVQWLVQNGANVHSIDRYNRTALHLAASGKDTDDLVQWLVQEGADIHAADIHNQTPLHAAVLGNNLARVQFLLPEGADLHAVDGRNKTLLHYAASGNNLDIVRWLVQKGADLHATNRDNRTPLHYAVRKSGLDMVEWLVQNGADLHAIDSYKQTPLHFAAFRSDNDDMVQWLVQNGADIHATDSLNRTPLHAAALGNNLITMQSLVQNGADLHAINNKNQTPLHHAVFQGHLDIVEWLIQEGAMLDAIDVDGKTPLHHAAFESHLQIMQWLVLSGADLNAIDVHNKTPLHYATSTRSVGMSQWLAQKPSGLHEIDMDKKPPLSFTVVRRDLYMVQWLVEKGANLHAVDVHQKTPLHYAALKGDVHVVQWLVQKGADPHALDSDNKTPIDCAASTGNSDLVQWFLQNEAHPDSTTKDEIQMFPEQSGESVCGFK